MVPPLLAELSDRYAIEREIGRGGMATVYLARDVRHNRKVALKVLNPELGAVLGVERFLSEIEVTANLQHPNLLPLFDSEEVNGLLYYVMPFVEGETLRARLEREKQLSVAEAIRISCAIAGALDYAHRHNVIHRDLKPENILMHEGQPLIADFGIALAVSNAGGSRITQTGLSLGTPLYMSPEQATGDRTVDGRADLYSLAVMTYEMLAGDPPHIASTSQAIIAKVLTEKPASLRASRATVPVHVEEAVLRGLEKLPADRFASAKEFSDALEGRGATLTRVAPTTSAVQGRGRSAREMVAWAIVALMGGSLAWREFASPTAHDSARPIRVNFDLPPGAHVNSSLVGRTIAVSPRGNMIAFSSLSASAFHIYVRRLDELNARELTSEAGANLTFSPDEKWIAFTEGNALKKISVDGGQSVTLGTSGSSVPYGLAWSPADTLYVGSFSGMWKMPAAGGTAVPVGAPDSMATRIGRRWPLLLPDGKTIAYVSGSNSADASHLMMIDTRTSATRDLALAMAVPVGMVDDRLIYVSDAGALMGVRMDGSHAHVVGDPVQLETGTLLDLTAGAKVSLSSSGTLAYLSGRAQYLPVVARANSLTTVPLLKDADAFSTPRYSPDGRRVAMTLFTGSAADIWVYEIGANSFTRLTTGKKSLRPEWTADGKYVVFISGRSGKGAIWKQAADGSAPAELLYQPEIEPYEAIISPDSKWLIYRTAPGLKFSRDILAVPLSGSDRTVVPLVTGPTTESMPRLSPDGRWLVYQSNETGRFDIYARPFPGDGARVSVSDSGGTEPLWDHSGKAIYYRAASGNIVKVDVTTGAQLSIGKRSVMLADSYVIDSTHPDWDVAPDGSFLFLTRAGEPARTIVVHNWSTELRQRMVGAQK